MVLVAHSAVRRHLIRPITHSITRARFAMSFSQPYTYITASDLAKAWRAQGSTSKLDSGDGGYAIVDVRDDDFEGGHIKGCWNVPSTQIVDRMDEVVERLKKVENVVFHCSLSQARGPKSARRYREARDEAIKAGTIPGACEKQSVMVLREGFANFGALYKKDPDLVEEYDEESWKYR